jgi:methionyl-tRNA formyltransferase
VVAADLGLDIVQPESRGELLTALRETGSVDLGVVVAFGQILRAEVLEIPAMGFLNVHFSLLPRWRGAAPVARAIEAGDTMTGVTIIKLGEGLDTGAVLTAQAVDIGPGEHTGDVTERLSKLGARLLMGAIPPYVAGTLLPVPQVDEGATYAAKITREDRPLDTGVTSEEFVNKVRALAPTPGATLELDGERHKVLEAVASDSAVGAGTWVAIDGQPVVGVGDGGVALLRIQPPGKREMDGASWLRGRRVTRGRAS